MPAREKVFEDKSEKGRKFFKLFRGKVKKSKKEANKAAKVPRRHQYTTFTFSLKFTP